MAVAAPCLTRASSTLCLQTGGSPTSLRTATRAFRLLNLIPRAIKGSTLHQSRLSPRLTTK